MHVLLINCHTTSDEDKTWKEFERLVRKCFSHMSEMMHFAVRKYNELGEYLQNYTMKCIYLDSRCFDKLDFIFIDGDKTYKPWAVSSKPLISLLKMCCQVGFKCVFGTAPVMASLCFVVATGGKEVKIKGKGGALASLQQGDADPIQFNNKLYLNNRSGDVFQPVQTEGVWTWKPVGNVGLRVHVPPPPQSSDIPRSVNESLFKKRKNYLHHWAFLGVPDQFVAPTASHFWEVADIPAWQGHPPPGVSKPGGSNPPSPATDVVCSTLNILGEIECGSAMLEYDSMIGVHFAVTEMYPFTVKILQNFVSSKLDIMMNFGNLPYPSHRLFRKLAAVGNFSKFEERPKPTSSGIRTHPFPNPQSSLYTNPIIPKVKISLSPSLSRSPSTSSSPGMYKRGSSNSPEKKRPSPPKKEKEKLSLPVVKVPPPPKLASPARRRPWLVPT